MHLLRFVRLGKFNWGGRACVLLLLAAATAIASPAQTFTTLHSFDGTDGSSPTFGALVQATDGNLYGTAGTGGANGSYGTVFRITPSGKLTTLYSFCAKSRCTDGKYPEAGLILAAGENFYGTTAEGGDNNAGTVFRITPSGMLTKLYSFCSQSGCADGEYPQAGLVQATNGSLYGTTSGGGAHSFGTVFKVTPSGTLTTLYTFCSQIGCTDGSAPSAGLVQAANGNLYGTTEGGGVNNAGTVFKITPGGTLATLYSFCSESNCTDGELPDAGLVQGANGNFYGTTYLGGANSLGTVFKITAGGTLTTLHSFDGTDGELPFAGLVQATNGSFYGTAVEGGVDVDYGTVFKITPSGTLTRLHSFDSTDGSMPYAGLVQATNGIFYGTTSGGGAHSLGTVFSVSVGLGPFVETQPTSGKVGAAVKILGTNLTGATSVTFNGTAATFTVVSKSEITTTVPTGATTGTVEVTTPSGTLKSNRGFRVTP
jgi:uncharacterized repeat protein (TIGR03803 family)